ncbi:hypothetical protein MTO96_035056, partial [Rhipicephalus appendiculatus]
MGLVNCYAHYLCLLLFLEKLRFAVSQGFDPDMLPYLAVGFRQLPLGE